jgi:hypothetical protein
LLSAVTDGFTLSRQTASAHLHKLIRHSRPLTLSKRAQVKNQTARAVGRSEEHERGSYRVLREVDHRCPF